jgi:aminomethyltransferase
MSGYQSLREGVAAIDLPERGRIRASGEDRKRLMHAMTTNHIQQLEPGQGVYAFFLSAQGRVLSDAVILCREDDLLVLTEAAARQTVYEHLDKFIIADDVTLEDLGPGTCEVAFEGPGAGAHLSAMGASLPDEPFRFTQWGERMVAAISETGMAGYRVIAPAADREALLAGVAQASAEDVEAVRHENGKPRFGVDFSEAQIAQETGLMHAMHFNKGCYLGQEIVERVRSRGHVNRRLTALRIASREVPAAGTKVMNGEKEAGEITSAAVSPANGDVRAFAIVRVENLAAGASLTVGGAAAEAVENVAGQGS